MCKKKLYLGVITIIAIMFSSCKKDTFYKKSNADRLKLYNWQILDVQVKIGNIYSIIDDCDKDNMLSFQNDSVATLNRGSILCDTLETKIFNGSWNIEPNDTTVNLFGYKYQLSAVTEERMGMWLRKFVINQTDTFDFYFYYKAVKK